MARQPCADLAGSGAGYRHVPRVCAADVALHPERGERTDHVHAGFDAADLLPVRSS
eukprot:TRINITY_DN21132_c0_g1_i1.p4 TRINITY_DN21132_c0_g1~~TRINITY_DN21132_c0_g1_i1.p4  ORF type:complete len:56 (+),score=1.44 TRINITY_DN21132_c0_g1_i1:170-337(+)